MQHFKRFGTKIAGWTAEDKKTCLANGSDKILFKYCLDRKYKVHYYMRVKGHSGGKRIDPKLQSNVLIPHGWTDYISHVGSTYENRSTSEGLIAGEIGVVRQGRQTCFFTAVDSMNVSMLTPRYEPNGPKKMPCTTQYIGLF